MKITRLGALSAALLAGSALAGGLLGDKVLAGGTRLGDHLRLYTAIMGAVEENYVDEVKSDRLVSSSIREMLRTLDPHSNFLETKEYGQLQERQRGSYYGLGITVQAVDGNITVVAPFEGTPAQMLASLDKLAAQRFATFGAKVDATGWRSAGHDTAGNFQTS